MEPTITTTHNNKPTPTPTPALLNGKKQLHQVKHAHPHPLYRECLKNHAAALGGHAVDGCGEFMSFPTSATCDPSSLTCAACGCHRNFHRRLYHLNLLEEENHHQMHSSSFPSSSSEDDEGEEGQSGPHMLLALSAGGNGGSPSVVGPHPAMAKTRRKRFRSRFSPEQKEKMYELSERLGWRMQRRDEGIIEERCGEIGVHRGVFKVWMHNNKHNYVSSGSPIPRRDTINANNGFADASSA